MDHICNCTFVNKTSLKIIPVKYLKLKFCFFILKILQMSMCYKMLRLDDLYLLLTLYIESRRSLPIFYNSPLVTLTTFTNLQYPSFECNIFAQTEWSQYKLENDG